MRSGRNNYSPALILIFLSVQMFLVLEKEVRERWMVDIGQNLLCEFTQVRTKWRRHGEKENKEKVARDIGSTVCQKDSNYRLFRWMHLFLLKCY